MNEAGTGSASRSESWGVLARGLELTGEAREAFLREVAGGDEQLLRDWRRLLAIMDADREFFRHGLHKQTDDDVVSLLLEELQSHSPRGDKYTIERELDRGGMGEILLAYDRDLRRRVALKRIRNEILERAGKNERESRREALILRLLEEAQVTGQLDHPGIVPVHELGLDAEGRVYFSMRLVRGEDLGKVLERARNGEPEWSLTRIVGVLQRCAEAMAYAHAKGVIHRDLKPANLMVGRFGEAYVMDWGLAHAAGTEDWRDLRLKRLDERPESVLHTVRGHSSDPESGSPLVTMDGEVIGTPYYMPAEQAEGDQSRIGPWSDVYSLGCILYEVLAGRPPYGAVGRRKSPEAVLASVLSGPPEPIETLAAKAPPALVAICRRAMQRDPEARYPDMGALAADLRAFLEGRVVRAHKVGAWAEATQWVRRNRLAAGLGVAVLTVLVLGGWTVARTENRRALLAEREADFALAGVLLETGRHLRAVDERNDSVRRAWLQSARDLLERRSRYSNLQLELRKRGRRSPEEDGALFPMERARQKELVAFVEDNGQAIQRKRKELDQGGEDLDELARIESELPVLEAAGARARAELEVLSRRLDSVQAWVFPDAAGSELHASLTAFQWTLDELALPEVGSVARVEADLVASADLEERSIGSAGAAAAWGEALDDLRDPARCPRFANCPVFPPQLGLVPLRKDPDSGLWEFWLVLSGARPELGEEGRWSIGAGVGLVLVLVPPQDVRLVTLRRATDLAAAEEPFERRVPLDAFFISKYEMTQEQWRRLEGSNPSFYFTGANYLGIGTIFPDHPVESVSWLDCEAALPRWGLELPTVAQWTAAARGGLDLQFGWLDAVEDLAGRVNSYVFGRANMHVAVDSLPPNPYGLHHVLGNVQEWVRDWSFSYLQDAEPRPIDGLLTSKYANEKSIRGGSFIHPLGPTFRVNELQSRRPDYRERELGVRPARPIVRG